MILVILFAVVGIVAMFATFMYVSDDGYYPFFGAFIALLVGGMIFGVWAGVSYEVTRNTDNLVRVDVQSHSLKALDTGSDSEGVFFLGSGYTSSGPSYTYLTQREDGGYEMASVQTYNAVVYQDDSQEPRMETARVRPESRLWSIMEVEAKKFFYVPDGSVQESEYRVNVER